MALMKRCLRLINGVDLSVINFSTGCSLHNKWRKEQGLEENPTRYGPLTNLRDYSFLDGRPVPLSAKKLRKVELQRHYLKKIADLSKEIDDELDAYNKHLEDEKLKKKTKIENKLKAKGSALLKAAGEKES